MRWLGVLVWQGIGMIMRIGLGKMAKLLGDRLGGLVLCGLGWSMWISDVVSVLPTRAN